MSICDSDYQTKIKVATSHTIEKMREYLSGKISIDKDEIKAIQSVENYICESIPDEASLEDIKTKKEISEDWEEIRGLIKQKIWLASRYNRHRLWEPEKNDDDFLTKLNNMKINELIDKYEMYKPK